MNRNLTTRPRQHAKRIKHNTGAMLWMLVQNDPKAVRWYARSQDGKREYEVSSIEERPRMIWQVRIAELGKIENLSTDLVSEWEAKNAAEMLEARHPLDQQAIAIERDRFNSILTRGGKKWECYGVIDNKQIWAYTPSTKQAYVIIYDYLHPDQGWTTSERTWVKFRGSGISQLKIKTLSRCKTLAEAQDTILRLT